ncbi:MAG TPA: hypothetical protein VFQ91_29035 [Bryobacteraceae bacterium]|nr:hypothetical protein [Bryobacteraceae bacterium]
MANASNTFPFFIAAVILSLTGLYFYATDLGKGAVVMECAAVLFLTVGILLRRHYRTQK